MAIVTAHPVSADADMAILSHIASLRQSISAQRTRAVALWDGCAPGAPEDSRQSREALGRYTQHLLNAVEEACG